MCAYILLFILTLSSEAVGLTINYQCVGVLAKHNSLWIIGAILVKRNE